MACSQQILLLQLVAIPYTKRSRDTNASGALLCLRVRTYSHQKPVLAGIVASVLCALCWQMSSSCLGSSPIHDHVVQVLGQ